jgi:RHS repeat-associated protein
MVSAATGQNPVTGTAYNHLTGQPTGVTFGSSDSDAFTYDSNTGRMTQYKFTVNGSSVIGNLTWNANGTVGTLGITDPFNASNAQTCNYGYDDLARIQSTNCGAVWSQTFSFDPFGNITKTGSIAFQPTYSTTTNRISTLPGFPTPPPPAYDANGNLTNDSVHTYTWDAEGKVLAVDTTSVTYDALGRAVEQARGSSYTQIVYGPQGNKLALMNGQTLTKAFVPLPGGATAVYSSSALSYYRHADWLGSSRFASTPGRAMYYDGAYAPYGENYSEAGTTDRSFTGQNQDTASAIYPLYDFLFREHHPTQGRWISPDPAGLAAVNRANPQSWNRYAYVLNNPANGIDPRGLDCRGISTYGCGLGQLAMARGLAQYGTGSGLYSGPTCTIDGEPWPCGLASDLLQGGGVARCPNDLCNGVNDRGQPVRYVAFAGIAEAVSGYYATWGVGNLSYSADQAGISASQWGAWYLGQTGSEVGGSRWCGYGICSSTLQEPGAPGASEFTLDFGFTDIPGGTSGQGWWRATNGESPGRDLANIDAANSQLGTSFPLFTGTTSGGGRVLLYGPANGWSECVLVGGLWQYGYAVPCH